MTVTAPPQTPKAATRAAAHSRWRSLGGFLIAVVVIVLLVIAAFGLEPASLLTLQNVVGLALFAVATNLLLGYGGLVSFGQAAFYGLGAYVIALAWHLKIVPFWVAFVVGPFVGALVALLMGLLALRSRRFYFALLTLAFSQLFYTIALKWYSVTDGENGLFGPMVPASLADPRNGFLFILGIVAVSLLILWKITRSPFGLVLRATRENRERAEALGVNVYLHQLLTFVISGFFCTLAGSLITITNQSAFPELLDWTKSGDAVFMAILGGMFVFLGPVIGAFIYQYGHDFIVQYIQDWELVLGLFLLFVVLVAPSGVAGLFSRQNLRDSYARLKALLHFRIPRSPSEEPASETAPEQAPDNIGPDKTGPDKTKEGD